MTAASSGSAPVSGRRTPLGRPEVPDVYSIGAPCVRGAGRLGRAVIAEPGQRIEARHGAHREPVLDPGQVRGRYRGPGEALVRHEGPGRAVAQDVGDLGGDLVPVDRHHVQAGLDGREVERERGRAVGQQPRDGVPRLEAERLQAAAVTICLAGQFGVADGAAVRFDHRGPGWLRGGYGPQSDGVHVPKFRTRSMNGQAQLDGSPAVVARAYGNMFHSET